MARSKHRRKNVRRPTRAQHAAVDKARRTAQWRAANLGDMAAMFRDAELRVGRTPDPAEMKRRAIELEGRFEKADKQGLGDLLADVLFQGVYSGHGLRWNDLESMYVDPNDLPKSLAALKTAGLLSADERAVIEQAQATAPR